jgi:hypothetical protein
MRRFVTVVALLLFAVPFGISINGCGKKGAVVTYCNGSDNGPVVGQLLTITLQPKIYGISINQAQIGQSSTPSGTDCKGTTVSSSSYAYGTTDMTLVDIQPTTGRLCGGTWNKNSGGGVADYTTCIPTGKSGIAYITATANGISSNPLPVYVHPVVTSVVLGPPLDSSGNPTPIDCQNNPTTACSPAATNTNLPASAAIGCSVVYPNGCCAQPSITTDTNGNPLSVYGQKVCVSQRLTTQFTAQVFAGTGANQTNISCQVGHLSYAAQSAGVVTIDQNGVATAQQPGSTIIDATISQAGSSAGFFSTCPPTDITLSYAGSTTNPGTPIIVNQNNTQPISATITDKNGTQLTGLALEYVSTTPITIPASSNGTVTPVFPGEASITAICQPPTCNTAPQSEIGVLGNGKPVTSKSVSVSTPGLNSTFLYIASTDSQYLVAQDFTQPSIGAPVRLPYVPNSMVISNDGSSIYLGSSTELMVVSAANSTVTKQDPTVRGQVLAVSPDNSTIVISDPLRAQTYLYSSSGAVTSTYGGVGTHAAWSPDSQTVYIAAGSQILVHSAFSGWKQIQLTTATAVNDVAVTVPAVGAYFSGAATTARGYCPATTLINNAAPPAASNQFYPPADSAAAITDRLAATNDGFHILGASAASNTLSDIEVNLAPVPAASNPAGSRSPSGGIVCPASGAGLTFSNVVAPVSLNAGTPAATIAPTAITAVLPTSDSKFAFITYTGTGGVLPAYQPTNLAPTGNTSGVGIAGTLTNIFLSGTAIAPVFGAISADNKTVYVGTSGDNLVHIVSTGSLSDTGTIAPALPSFSGANGPIAVPNLLVEKPRATT